MPESIQSVHGHEIIHLIHDAPAPFTRATLAEEVARRFGSSPRFHTCSLADMTLDQLVGFLISHGKVVENAGQLRVNLQSVCDDAKHDHGNDKNV